MANLFQEFFERGVDLLGIPSQQVQNAVFKRYRLLGITWAFCYFGYQNSRSLPREIIDLSGWAIAGQKITIFTWTAFIANSLL